MERKRIITADGSHTLYIPELNEHFHSVHGAVQESMHVFIRAGLERCTKNQINIFEVGFGTGLNALLTFLYRGHRNIRYYSIERYPLQPEEYEQLNFAKLIAPEAAELFQQMHACQWNRPVMLAPGFELFKIESDLSGFDPKTIAPIDLVYFDAFAPDKQPGMWEEEIFRKISEASNPEGIIVTYCAKGEVRRRMMRSGYRMQRLPGPPGKKEMLFGCKAEITPSD